ncbi:hypothetical protein BKA93DRAFT_744519 [Sparassis latifolia]
MSKPIILWKPRPKLTSDDACTTILKYSLPPPPNPPPYASTADDTSNLSYIPSLAYFCIQKLHEYPDQVHSIGPARIAYQPPDTPESYDILRALIPFYRPDEQLDLSQVDPRLWAVLIQLYSDLPEIFRTYKLALSDPHLQLLQRIPSTVDFSVLTVLELPYCLELTDDTVVELRALYNLCALDASGTALSVFGLKTLAKTLTYGEDEEHVGNSLMRPRRGPWGLRILSLRNCINVNNTIFECLESFPLLSVVGMDKQRISPFSLIPHLSCRS